VPADYLVAVSLLKQGWPLPVDLKVKLMELGYSPAALERKHGA
jgi:hypothetical protein